MGFNHRLWWLRFVFERMIQKALYRWYEPASRSDEGLKGSFAFPCPRCKRRSGPSSPSSGRNERILFLWHRKAMINLQVDDLDGVLGPF